MISETFVHRAPLSNTFNKKQEPVSRSKELALALLNKKRVKKATNHYTSISRMSLPSSRVFAVVFLTPFSSGPDESQIQRAKVLAEDLLLVVRQEHAKMQLALQQQQMELHQAQAQYAAYSAMAAVRYSCIPFFSYLNRRRYLPFLLNRAFNPLFAASKSMLIGSSKNLTCPICHWCI